MLNCLLQVVIFAQYFPSVTQTRNATRCNSHDDLANHSFILKVSVFSDVYVEPSRTSLIKLLAEIAESRSLIFMQKAPS